MKVIVNLRMLKAIKSLMVVSIIFLEVTILSGQYVPGDSYFSPDGYIKYIAGNSPIILSAPHGGYLEPTSIPDRDCTGCVYVRDARTQELSREINQAFADQTGCHPHIIINLLRRTKLDANRDIGEAADGNQEAEAAWAHFHDFIEIAKNDVNERWVAGLLLDIHGHSHEVPRIELGYLMSANDLRQDSTFLNRADVVDRSSIQDLVEDNLHGESHSDLLIGDNSLGEIFGRNGFRSVPSRTDPFPMVGEDFFSGGYNTRRHGSRDSGTISSIQIECNRDIRFNETIRLQWAEEMTNSIRTYIDEHIIDGFLDQECQSTGIRKDLSYQPSVTIRGNTIEISVPQSWGSTKAEIFDITGILISEDNLLEYGELVLPEWIKGVCILRLQSLNGMASFKLSAP